MIGWLDCAAGVGGDMLLGALVDAGVQVAALQAAVDGLDVEPITLSAGPTTRHGIGATAVSVQAPPSTVHRTWADIRAILGAARLAEPVRDAALGVFERLAIAEAAVHRVRPDEVHFHEVGALDSLADVVGVCAGLHELQLGRLVASRVALGNGRARGAHGGIPVPAPAVLALLAEVGAPVEAGPSPFESCTPTGAALLAAHVDEWGGLPPMTVRRTGYGAGGRDPVEVPNLVRLVLGTPADDMVRTASVLEANVDDLDPRVWPQVLAAMLEAGASDAWLSPIVMKKGRPAHTLHALVPPGASSRVRRAMFAHSSTIGVRELAAGKHELPREHVSVQVDRQPIRIKRAMLDGAVVNASVEFDDVAAAAAALELPVKVMLARATATAQAAGLLP